MRTLKPVWVVERSEGTAGVSEHTVEWCIIDRHQAANEAAAINFALGYENEHDWPRRTCNVWAWEGVAAKDEAQTEGNATATIMAANDEAEYREMFGEE